jgi:hypothetical protein
MEVLHAATQVVHAAGSTVLVQRNSAHHAVGAHLGSVRERVGDVGDERRRLGVDLASLQAEASVDAVVPVPEAPVGDGHWSDPDVDAEPLGAADEDEPVAADRVRRLRVAVRVSPGPVLAGHRKLLLDELVVATEVQVADGPVRAHAIDGMRGEVARVEPGRVAGEVHHRAADTTAGVVGAQRNRVVAGDDAGLGPVQVVRPGLVAHPVGVGVPERSRIERDDLPPGTGQPLQ